MSNAQGIEKQILSVKSDLASAKAEHAAASLSLVDASGDAKLQAQLESLEQEIAEHERKIKRLDAAKAEAEKRDTAESKAAELARLKQARADVDKGLARQGEIMREIVSAIDKLTPLVAELEVVGADTAGSGFAVLRGCCDHRELDRRWEPIADLLRGNATGVRAVVADALYRTALGRSGLHLRPFVSIDPSRENFVLDDVLRNMRHKVSKTLDQVLDRRESELLTGKAATNV